MIPSIGGRGGSGRCGLIPRGKQVGAERRYSQLIVLSSLPRQQLKFFRSSRPVLSQQSRQGTVGEQLSSGLAIWAVIGFIGRITYALNFCLAPRTWFLIAPMHRHFRAKRRDFFREFVASLST